MAILDKPKTEWQEPFKRHIDTWADRVVRAEGGQTADGQPVVAPMILNNSRYNRVAMSILTTTRKKQTSKKKHIRVKIVRKIKTALSLIVIRGADAKEVKGRSVLVFNEDEAKEVADKWILAGWSYIYQPTLKIYRMPYPDLVRILRIALRRIWDQGMIMEEQWAANQLADQKKAKAVREQISATLKSALRLESGKNELSSDNEDSLKNESYLKHGNQAKSHASGKSPIRSPKLETNTPQRLQVALEPQAPNARAEINSEGKPKLHFHGSRVPFGLRGTNISARSKPHPQQIDDLETKLKLESRSRERKMTMAQTLDMEAEKEAMALFDSPPQRNLGTAFGKRWDRGEAKDEDEDDDLWKEFHHSLGSDDISDQTTPSANTDKPKRPIPNLFFPSRLPRKLEPELSSSPMEPYQRLHFGSQKPPSSANGSGGAKSPVSAQSMAKQMLFNKRAVFRLPQKRR